VRLRDLDARLVRREIQTDGSEHWVPVETVAEADGLCFVCPGCVKMLGSLIGAHSVMCWFVGKVADDVDPKPGRWNPSGTTIDDITFIGPSAASIALTGAPCAWHGFVKGGTAE
jgi:hypothetical protein